MQCASQSEHIPESNGNPCPCYKYSLQGNLSQGLEKSQYNMSGETQQTCHPFDESINMFLLLL